MSKIKHSAEMAWNRRFIYVKQNSRFICMENVQVIFEQINSASVFHEVLISKPKNLKVSLGLLYIHFVI